MKRSVLIFSLAAFSSFSFAQNITNGGFEDWTELETYSSPDVSPSDFTSGNEEFFEFLQEAAVTEVTGVTGSAMRLETHILEDEIFPGFAIWGGTPDGEDLLFPGGFVVDDMAVEGLSVDLRYDIDETSPGVILVQFKAGGEPVSGGPDDSGTYFFQVSGVQDVFANMTFDFDPPLGETPDQCVIAFTSNDIISDPATGFEGDYLVVDNVSFIGTDNAVPGGDLDTWMPGPIINIPEDWGVAPGPVNNYDQSDNAWEGDYSIALTTIPVDPEETEFFPGIVFKGGIGDDGIVASIPLPGEAVGVNFAYNYMPVEEDSAIVMLVLSEDLENSEESVYFTGEILYGTEGWEVGYIDFSEALEFFNPQYYALVFFSSFTEDFEEIDHAGSVLLVDGTSFEIDEGACSFDPTVDTGNITLCPGETVTVTTEDSWDSLQWYYDQTFNPGNPMPINGETMNTIVIDNSYVGQTIWCEATFDGCTEATSSFNVDEYFFLAPSVGSNGPTEVCEPDQVLLANQFGEYLTYQWQIDGTDINGAETDSYLAEESGDYTLVVTPFECPSFEMTSLPETVTIFPTPEPEINLDGNELSTTLSWASYQWYLDDSPISGADEMTWTAEEDGSYWVEVTDDNGCSGDSDQIDVIVTGIHESGLEINSIYPNPGGKVDAVIITTSDMVGHIELINALGQVVLSQNVAGTFHAIPVNTLASGMYFIRLRAENKQYTRRWIK